MIEITHYDSPCGRLILGSIGDALCLCDWDIYTRRQIVDSRLCREFNTSLTEGDNEVLRGAKKQLDEYFSYARQNFDIHLVFAGSDLRHHVWHQLQTIAYGETLSYQDFAEKIGRPTAIRAVASAIGANPISIFIPCHRVIGKNGSLTGYAGGLPAKRLLVNLEQEYKKSHPLGQDQISS